MAKDMKKHQVVFNMNDQEQAEMYHYLANSTNVSAKLKRLVLLDMMKVERNYNPAPIIEMQIDDTIDELALELIL